MDVPEELFVKLEEGHDQAICAGHYRLVPGEAPNGLPCWEREAGDDSTYIFSSPGGTWLFCNKAAKEDSFAKGLGVVKTSLRHGGNPPHELGDWDYMVGGKWKKDPAIKVTSALQEEPPKQLWVSLPVGHAKSACGGRYQLVEGAEHNGMPFYAKEAFQQTCYLFASSGGTWFIIVDKENLRGGFSKAKGEVKSHKRSGGVLPHEISTWAHWTGKEYVKEVDITVSTEFPEIPKTLFLKLKPGHPVANCAGMYHHVDGEFANGMPVYSKDAGGQTLHFYASPWGRWCISGGAKQEFFNCDRARVGSQSNHGGHLPHEMGEDIWRYTGEKKGEWIPEPCCRITSAGEGFSPAAGSTSARKASDSLPKASESLPKASESLPRASYSNKQPFPVMFSGRFKGGPREKHLRDTADCLAKHEDLQVLVVEAHAGESFDEQTEQNLHKMRAMVCMAYEDYGEKTASKYCTYYELQYADDYNKELVPVKLYKGDWPPAPDDSGTARNLRILRPSRVFVDATTKDGILSPEELANQLYEHLKRFF